MMNILTDIRKLSHRPLPEELGASTEPALIADPAVGRVGIMTWTQQHPTLCVCVVCS